jgi:hypothetical protein
LPFTTEESKLIRRLFWYTILIIAVVIVAVAALVMWRMAI